MGSYSTSYLSLYWALWFVLLIDCNDIFVFLIPNRLCTLLKYTGISRLLYYTPTPILEVILLTFHLQMMAWTHHDWEFSRVVQNIKQTLVWSSASPLSFYNDTISHQQVSINHNTLTQISILICFMSYIRKEKETDELMECTEQHINEYYLILCCLKWHELTWH